MTEIKFRAWSEKNKRWDYFNLRNILYYAKELSEHLLNGDEFYLFTGLYDKNGKGIGEGDVLSMWGFNNVVEWKDGAFGYIDDTGKFHSFADHEWITKPQLNAEVIGNIYVNPELLEKK